VQGSDSQSIFIVQMWYKKKNIKLIVMGAMITRVVTLHYIYEFVLGFLCAPTF